MAIRYDKKLEKEISQTVRNFNQKVSRLEKLDRELLPEKVSKKELKQIYSDRIDLKRKLKELQKFSERGAEKIITTKGGVRLTQYQLNNLKDESKRVKQFISREINRLKTTQPKVFGKQQDITFAQMGDEYYLTMLGRKQALDKNFLELSKQEFERYTDLVNRLGKNQGYMRSVFKDNYLKMLTDLGYYYDYSDAKLDVLKQKIRDLDSRDFLELFRNDKSINAILNYYPVVTGSVGINPQDIKADVYNLYDNLFDNLDEILKPYA